LCGRLWVRRGPVGETRQHTLVSNQVMRALCIATILQLALPCALRACMCMWTLDQAGDGRSDPVARAVEQALRDSDAVFRGQVVDIRPAEGGLQRIFRRLGDLYYKYLRSPDEQWARSSRFTSGPEYGLLVTLQAHRVWKGRAEGRVTLTTGFGQGDCGVSFQEGMTYLVYASIDHSSHQLSTSICTRTAPIHLAVGDTRVLNGGWF
jgi:hypothetical protein